MNYPWEHLTSINRIVALHRQGIERYGGDFANPRDGCVDGGLGAAWNAELYTEAQGSIQGFNFACFLLCYLARDHCFTDGNKRVAWLAFVDILLKLGLTVKAETNEAEQLVLGVILHQLETNDVCMWTAERLEAIS